MKKGTKNMSKGLKILLIVLGSIAAIALTAIVIVVFATSGERQKAKDFVDDASAGQTASAYNQFSPKLKQVQDQTTFEAQIASLQLDESCELDISGIKTSTSTSTSTGSQQEVSGSVVCDDKELAARFVYSEGLLYSYSIKY
jgi:ABC-type Na+ efflux pump permease subunit